MKKNKTNFKNHLWILSILYLTLGLFNILFAWLGLICFLVPLIISASNGGKNIVTPIAEEVSYLIS